MVETGVHKTYVECLLCGYQGTSLTGHLRYHHKITAKEYKEAFSLCYNQPLECEETTRLRKQAVKDNPHVLKNLLVDGVGTRFRKGDSGNTRVCEQRIERIKNNPQTYKRGIIHKLKGENHEV
jgi:hypothetical protein